MGHKTISQARRNEELTIDGSRREIGALSKWFALSHFAQYADVNSKQRKR